MSCVFHFYFFFTIKFKSLLDFWKTRWACRATIYDKAELKYASAVAADVAIATNFGAFTYFTLRLTLSFCFVTASEITDKIWHGLLQATNRQWISWLTDDIKSIIMFDAQIRTLSLFNFYGGCDEQLLGYSKKMVLEFSQNETAFNPLVTGTFLFPSNFCLKIHTSAKLRISKKDSKIVPCKFGRFLWLCCTSSRILWKYYFFFRKNEALACCVVGYTRTATELREFHRRYMTSSSLMG